MIEIIRIIIHLTANILMIIGSLITLISAINFLKSKNILNNIHYITLANIYGISIILIGLAIKDHQIQNLVRILVIIIINLIVAVILNKIFINREYAK